MCIGYTKSVASISNHVKMGNVTCLFWLPLLLSRGSPLGQSEDSEQSCDRFWFDSISVPKIRSTPNSKWSSLGRVRQIFYWSYTCDMMTSDPYLICDSVIWSVIWIKHARESFSKTIKTTRARTMSLKCNSEVWYFTYSEVWYLTYSEVWYFTADNL